MEGKGVLSSGVVGELKGDVDFRVEVQQQKQEGGGGSAEQSCHHRSLELDSPNELKHR